MLHGEVDTAQFTSGHLGVVAGLQRADSKNDGVVTIAQLGDGQVVSDVAVGDELGALPRHLGDPPVDVRLLHLVLGDAVAEQTADTVVSLVDGHRMTRSGELLRGRQTSGTRTDHRNRFAGQCRRGLRDDESLSPCFFGNRLLDALDGDAAAGGGVRDGQHTGRLAGRRAELAGELGEVVGGVQAVTGRIPPATAHQVVPFGDQVAQRAACRSRVTERDSAVHAPAGLLGDVLVLFVGVFVDVDLTPVVDPFVHRPGRGLGLADLQESARISHEPPP